MKKNEVKIGGLYRAKVSDKLVTVRIDSTNSHGGWNAVNTATGKRIRIKSAERLRGPAASKGEQKKAPAAKEGKAARKPAESQQQIGEAPRNESTQGEAAKLETARAKKAVRKDKDAKTKRTSALDAAAQVLKAEGKPMTCKAMIAAMAEQGLWTSPNGKTPQATLYSAILREIRKAVETGTVSRFRKTDRGQFEFNAVAAKGE
jgi:hypothetical protein